MLNKIVGLLFALCLLAGLSACGQDDSPENAVTEQAVEYATIVSQPRAGAVMEPQQGGPMLYPCWSKKTAEEDDAYHLRGLINQKGELVQEPVYSSNAEYMQYMYDQNGRVVGLAARTQESDEIHFYSLDGTRKVLKAKWDEDSWDAGFTVLTGGRYAAITTSVEEERNSPDIHTASEGLYDIQAGIWIFESKRGRSVSENSDGFTCFITDHKIVKDRADYTQPVSCWALDMRSGELKERAPLPGDATDYYPNAGWYTHMREYYNVSGSANTYNLRQAHDAETDEPVNLQGWYIHRDFEGEYAIVKQGDYPDFTFAFINRSLELQPERYFSCPEIYNNGDGFFYKVEDQNGAAILLDKELNVLCKADNQEQLLFQTQRISQAQQRCWGSLVLRDDEGQVKVFRGLDGETQPSCMQTFTFSDCAYFWNGSEWSVIETEPYLPPMPRKSRWYSPRAAAHIRAVCLDYAVIETGYDVFYGDETDGEWEFELEERFAVNWQGKRLSSYPLEPYWDSINWLHSIGEQALDYFWVKKDNECGYINANGEWLYMVE